MYAARAGLKTLVLDKGLTTGALGITGKNWFLLVVSGLLFFSAVYNRCLVWKAVSGYIKKVINRQAEKRA